MSLSGQELRVETVSTSTLFSAPHRIFFTNVLSFDFDEDGPAYVLTGGESLGTVNEIIRYLEEIGFPIALNQEASQISAAARNDQAARQIAQEVGSKLKRRPQRTIEAAGLKRPPKPYQVPAVAHLINVPHAANFSVPGSGKTAIVLMAFAALRSSRAVEKLVVVGPSSAFTPWEEEARATLTLGLRSLRITGSKTRRTRLYRAADRATLVLLTYHMASNDAEELAAFLRRHKVMFVLDESHNIKRLEGGKWAETLIGIAPLAAKRVILSGTPMPNSILDLWSQVRFLWPNNSPLGEREEFRYRAGGSDEPALEATRHALFPFYWRIRKEDLGLPKPRYYRIGVSMSRYQRAIYSVLAAKVLGELVRAPEERAKLRLWRRARMVRLLQTASNPALLAQYSKEFRIPPIDASGLPVDAVIEKYSEFEIPEKLRALDELTRQLVAKGRQVIIWTAFIHNILTLEQRFADLKPAKLYGDIPRDEREDEEVNRELIIRRFKEGAYKVLIANPSACAESVSLHKVCHDAIYLDRTFNAAHYLQSLDRIHRVGLERHEQVRYYILQSKESIDEVIDVRLDEKIHRMNRLLNEDLAPLNLESPAEEFSEESEEEADFAAVVESLKKQAS